jgi:hypothetical protein
LCHKAKFLIAQRAVVLNRQDGWPVHAVARLPEMQRRAADNIRAQHRRIQTLKRAAGGGTAAKSFGRQPRAARPAFVDADRSRDALGDRRLADAFIAERLACKPRSPINLGWAMWIGNLEPT